MTKPEKSTKKMYSMKILNLSTTPQDVTPTDITRENSKSQLNNIIRIQAYPKPRFNRSCPNRA